MDPSADLATKFRTTSSPTSDFNPDEVNFFPAAQIYITRMPELSHLLEALPARAVLPMCAGNS